MATYYTPDSLALVGSREVLRCQMTTAWKTDGGVPVKCEGPVTFIWIHGGYGDGEVTACQAWIERNPDPPYGYVHALYRDKDGVWQLKGDADIHPSVSWMAPATGR